MWSLCAVDQIEYPKSMIQTRILNIFASNKYKMKCQISNDVCKFVFSCCCCHYYYFPCFAIISEPIQTRFGSVQLFSYIIFIYIYVYGYCNKTCPIECGASATLFVGDYKNWKSLYQCCINSLTIPCVCVQKLELYYFIILNIKNISHIIGKLLILQHHSSVYLMTSPQLQFNRDRCNAKVLCVFQMEILRFCVGKSHGGWCVWIVCFALWKDQFKFVLFKIINKSRMIYWQ